MRWFSAGEVEKAMTGTYTDGRAYARCPDCDWFDTYRDRDLAREKFATHYNYVHAAGGCRAA